MAYEPGLLGLKEDEKTALEMYRNAADGGVEVAQCFLGCAYEDGGIGLDVNLKNALLWLQKAADGGHGDAQCKIGYAYVHGSLEFDVDKELALFWHQKAANGVKEKRSFPSDVPKWMAVRSGSMRTRSWHSFGSTNLRMGVK